MQDKNDNSWENLKIYIVSYSKDIIYNLYNKQVSEMTKANVQTVTINLSHNIFHHLDRLTHSRIMNNGSNNYYYKR